MPTTTTTLKAFLGESGLAGTAGLTIYAANGTTVVLARSATVASIAEIGATRNYQLPNVSVSYDTEYTVVWDRAAGDTLPASTLYIPSGVNVVTVGGVTVRNGDGTATVFDATHITLSASDPRFARNNAGALIELLYSTGNGGGQHATIASSNTSTGQQTIATGWSDGVLPTGSVDYRIVTPQPTDTATIASAVWNVTGLFGDGSKAARKTFTKAFARLFGKMDTATTPGTAIFKTVDGTATAYTQPYNSTVRSDHTAGSGL